MLDKNDVFAAFLKEKIQPLGGDIADQADKIVMLTIEALAKKGYNKKTLNDEALFDKKAFSLHFVQVLSDQVDNLTANVLKSGMR